MSEPKQRNVAQEVLEELIGMGAYTDRVVKWDGYDDAIVGYAYVFREGAFRYCTVYAYNKLIDCYLQGVNLECGDDPILEAEEYIDFNLINAWIGPNTPIVAREWFDK